MRPKPESYSYYAPDVVEPEEHPRVSLFFFYMLLNLNINIVLSLFCYRFEHDF